MPVSIAIDGPAGAGKSTIAKAVSARLGALYLDTGAMYRAVGLYMVRAGVPLADDDAVAAAVPGAQVAVRHENGAQRVFLNGEDVSAAIREPEISMAASRVSAVPAVREALVAMQRRIAENTDIVMDGRDIGTHVLPHATLKIYLVADERVRAQRRFAELQAKGAPDTFEQVLADLIRRDRDDSTRAASPLRKAEDAVEVDTTDLTIEQATARILSLAEAAVQGGRL